MPLERGEVGGGVLLSLVDGGKPGSLRYLDAVDTRSQLEPFRLPKIPQTHLSVLKSTGIREAAVTLLGPVRLIELVRSRVRRF